MFLLNSTLNDNPVTKCKMSTSNCQIILVELKKVQKVLNILNNNDNMNQETPHKKIIHQNHLKNLISIFGEKKFLLSKNNIHKALPYLLKSKTYNNGKMVQSKLLKLIFFASSGKGSIGEFYISSNNETKNLFGWLTREEIEDNLMKILEQLTDIHETFNMEKLKIKSPVLTCNLIKNTYEEKWIYQNLEETARQFEEMVTVLFSSLRKAHQYNLDMVVMEEEF